MERSHKSILDGDSRKIKGVGFYLSLRDFVSLRNKVSLRLEGSMTLILINSLSSHYSATEITELTEKILFGSVGPAISVAFRLFP